MKISILIFLALNIMLVKGSQEKYDLSKKLADYAEISSIIFSPNCRFLTTGSIAAVRIWDLSSGKHKQLVNPLIENHKNL